MELNLMEMLQHMGPAAMIVAGGTVALWTAVEGAEDDAGAGGRAIASRGVARSDVVVGIGVNVDAHPQQTLFPATSLKEEGVEIVSAKIVLSRFIHHFIECYNEWNNKGFAPIRKRWVGNAWGMKKEITARLPDREITGTAQEIDPSGCLVIKDKKGAKHIIHAADIFPAEKELA